MVRYVFYKPQHNGVIMFKNLSFLLCNNVIFTIFGFFLDANNREFVWEIQS